MTVAPTAEPRSQKQEDDAGFWASLSPADQKKYTLVFLVSLGTTLLVTGRSGGSLLKRAKKSEASTPPTPVNPKRPQPPPPPPPRPTLSTRPLPPVATPRLAPKSTLLEPPPTSFLHPNSLSPNRRRKLLPSFTTTPPSSSSSSSSTTTTSYFLPNSTLTSHSTAYALELDRQDKLHEDGPPPPQESSEPEVDDGFNPAIYAAKALGIATVITFTSFGLGVYGIMKWLGVQDMESLSLALSHRLGDKLKENRPSLPSWALPSTTSSSPSPSSPPPPPPPMTTTATEREKEEEEEEEMSYWNEVKETLDREAEARTRQRREQWEEFLKTQGSIPTSKTRTTTAATTENARQV